MRSAIKWCHNFLHLALHFPDYSPITLLETNKFTFPQFEPYEFETEQVYQFTNFDKNSRKDVTKRLEMLREHINIDDMATSSKDVYAVMNEKIFDMKTEESFFE
jgi:hypothetical protein